LRIAPAGNDPDQARVLVWRSWRRSDGPTDARRPNGRWDPIGGRCRRHGSRAGHVLDVAASV